MEAPQQVELEAARFLQTLIKDSKDEPSKLATKLYAVCQHMKLSGKENSMPYQVISRAMENIIVQHGIDINALSLIRNPSTAVPQVAGKEVHSNQFDGGPSEVHRNMPTSSMQATSSQMHIPNPGGNSKTSNHGSPVCSHDREDSIKSDNQLNMNDNSRKTKKRKGADSKGTASVQSQQSDDQGTESNTRRGKRMSSMSGGAQLFSSKQEVNPIFPSVNMNSKLLEDGEVSSGHSMFGVQNERPNISGSAIWNQNKFPMPLGTSHSVIGAPAYPMNDPNVVGSVNVGRPALLSSAEKFGYSTPAQLAMSSGSQMLEKEKVVFTISNGPIEIPLPPSSHTQSFGSAWVGVQKMEMEGSKRKTVDMNNPIQKAYNMERRSLLDGEIARAFYSGGLSFHFARNPHYRKSYTMASEFNLSSYVPPSYNALRTTLLQKERANVERCLESIKTTWKEKGVSIVSDGWSDSQRRPLINFMAVTENGPMFLKAVNCEGEYKDKFHIANLIREVIMEVGSQNVVQVVTDNAPVCKAAGMIIEASFPHIFWTPCTVHTLNLALKNICDPKNTESNKEAFDECNWIKEVANTAMMIKNFILNHNMVNTMFNMISPLKLLTVAETRFASVIIMLKRFKLLKRPLERLVLCEEWSTYCEYDLAKALIMRTTILDKTWWDKVEYILQFTGPMYDMIRFADRDKPSLHLIYDMWDDMIEKVKTIIYNHEKKELFENFTFYDVVYGILIVRWTKSSSPLHCLAHSLNPRYYSHAWLSAAQDRIPPHQDIELSQERNKCIKRYFPDQEARQAVSVEFARFSGQMDTFGSADSIEDRGTVDPKMWWLIHGASAPNIQKIALKLLGQPCSSSCCERNWSTYSFIHSVRRNKILPSRADDLVYVHNNL